MAVRNEWPVLTQVEAGGRQSGAGGRSVKAVAGTFEIAAADDDASIFKLAKIPANAIITKAEIYSDALTSGNDWDLGFYKENGDAADVNILTDALDLSSGVAVSAAANNGLVDLGADAPAYFGKKVWELLGLTVNTKEESYVLALTANTIGSAAGTVAFLVEWIEG